MANAVQVLQASRTGRGSLIVLELASRVGYLARGVVYISVGLIAFLAAIGVAPRPRGPIAALEAWGEWRFGVFLLWLTAFGLAAFCGWRIMQSVFNVEGRSPGLAGWCGRIGQGFSALMYLVLTWSAFKLIDTLADLHQLDDAASTRAVVKTLLNFPFYGAKIVLAVGVVTMAIGVGNLVQAALRNFAKRLRCNPKFGRKAIRLARIGYSARGVVFFLVGLSIATAGLHSSDAEAQSAGGALSYLRALPFGDALLGFTAIGLIAFGLFAFVEARYRDIGMIRASLATSSRDARLVAYETDPDPHAGAFRDRRGRRSPIGLFFEGPRRRSSARHRVRQARLRQYHRLDLPRRP
ncbi:MAG TPA: DUF1206 domain-containing protein [Caulobacteraceae bacterium]|nr:DUF1206 domain-containing protein [Caulobacteraceae bacterium]